MILNRTQITALVHSLPVTKGFRFERLPSWQYLRRELYAEARRRHYRLTILIDKETDEMIILRLK